jgi:hypothetical protein
MKTVKEKIQREDGKVYRIDVIQYLMDHLDGQASIYNTRWMMSNLKKLIHLIEAKDWEQLQIEAEKIWNEEG